MAKTKSQKRLKRKPVTSPYCKPAGSKIHQQGLFATKRIPADEEIIPYVGEKISKKEGDRRAIDLAEEREGTEDASVYMFILDDDYDIDGNVPHNTARLINHSCEPNCEAQIIEDEIWIVALREIPKGEELTFDYGFDLEHYEEHPCRCGRPSCVGYIVAREYWPKLNKLLAAKKKKSGRRVVASPKKTPSKSRRKAKKSIKKSAGTGGPARRRGTVAGKSPSKSKRISKKALAKTAKSAKSVKTAKPRKTAAGGARPKPLKKKRARSNAAKKLGSAGRKKAAKAGAKGKR